MALRLLIAQQVAALGLFALHHHLDHVAGMQLGLPGVIGHLLQRNEALALQTHIHHHMLVRQLHHCARDDVVFIALRNGGLGGLLAVKGLQCRGKILHAHVFVCRFGSRDRCVMRLRLGGLASIAVVVLGALVVVGGFGRRLFVLRRGIKRWGFQFGVQRFALGLFRMLGVCHSNQLRIRRRRHLPPRRSGNRPRMGRIGQSPARCANRGKSGPLRAACKAVPEGPARLAPLRLPDGGEPRALAAACIFTGRRFRWARWESARDWSGRAAGLQ